MSADKPDVAALIDSGALAEAANRLRFERSRYCEKLADACDQAAAALQSQQARIAELEKLVAELEGHIDAALRIINS
jgi:hypothetical protein